MQVVLARVSSQPIALLYFGLSKVLSFSVNFLSFLDALATIHWLGRAVCLLSGAKGEKVFSPDKLSSFSQFLLNSCNSVLNNRFCSNLTCRSRWNVSGDSWSRSSVAGSRHLDCEGTPSPCQCSSPSMRRRCSLLVWTGTCACLSPG